MMLAVLIYGGGDGESGDYHAESGDEIERCTWCCG